MKVFLLGAGNSAKIILDELNFEKVYVYDKNFKQFEKLKEIHNEIEYLDIKNLETTDVDYIIEVASVEALKNYGLKLLDMNKNLIVLSTGAFADKIFRYNFVKKLNNKNINVYVVSGAIGGIDLIRTISDKINTITLITRKTPKSLGIDIKKEKIIFEGNSIEAIERFPKNINVAVTLALAIKNFEKVKVKIIADPFIERNVHSIEIKSKVGNYTFKFENYPSKNPKTSYLAPLSIVGLLKNIHSKFKIGG
ncbi:aspartate dehydrogenase [Marinitoga sp. 1155]|uniref:aspartate dehydrogenase n=1 Tax=Marinitoga sp. 1155 TaxID=1428448 RepID=UPI0006414126|nr:aspartate dehydrogenase [Marinitoga sp. 1155]KLO23161.1 hypothetical protein X274_06925 [Marinitoga sp. 1155]